MDEPLLNTNELAKWLGISERAIERWREGKVSGGPPYVRVGKVVRYRRADVEKWLQEREVRA